MTDRSQNSKNFISELKIEPVMSDMINSLLHDLPDNPKIYMIKYIIGLMSEGNRVENNINVSGPYPGKYVKTKKSSRRGKIDLSGKLVDPDNVNVQEQLTTQENFVTESVFETKNTNVYNISQKFLDQKDYISFFSALSRDDSLERLKAESLSDNNIEELSTALLDNKTLKTIELSRGSFYKASSSEAFAKVLKKNKTLTSINLHNALFSEHAAKIIFEAFKQSTTLEVMNLKSCLINDFSLIFAQAMKNNKTLKSLDVSCNDFTNEAETALFESLAENKNLVKLDLTYTSISSAFIKILGINDYLTDLNLDHNKFSHEDVIVLSEELKSSKSLKILSLANCDLRAKSLELIANTLVGNVYLHEINLSDNNHFEEPFVSQIYKSLAQVLYKNKTLKKLDIATMKIEDVEPGNPINLADLARALKSNNTLTELNLNNPKITDTDSQELCEALNHNKTLQKLELKNTSTRERNVRANVNNIVSIVDVLKTNHTLTELDLSNWNFTRNSINDLILALSINNNLQRITLNKVGKDAYLICESIKTSKSLIEINLAQNDINDEGGIALAESIGKNNTLEIINLEANKVRDGTFTAFSETLKINKFIKKINLNRNKADKESVISLTEAFYESPSLIILDLSSSECTFSLDEKDRFRYISRCKNDGLKFNFLSNQID